MADYRKRLTSVIRKQNAAEADGKQSAERDGKKRFLFDFEYFFRAITQVIVAVVAIGLVFYFGYHLVRGLTSSVTTSTVYGITESAYCSAEGYIIRDEKPISSGVSGTADYLLEDGARVAKNDRLCNIYRDGSDAVKERIADLNAEIRLLKGSITSGTVVSGIVDVSADISHEYNEIMKYISEGDYASAAELSDSFRQSLDRLRHLSGKGSGISGRIETLTAERDAAVASLGTASGSVYASEPGYFFTACDGYEGIFTAKLASELTPEALEKAIAAEPASVSGTVGKLVVSPKWYLAVLYEGDGLVSVSQGSTCRITFMDNGGQILSMYTEKSTVLDDGRQLLLFSSTDMPEGFRYQRCQNIHIEYASYDGYRIPFGAVHQYDGMTGVYTLHGGYVYFRKINVIGEVDGYFIVSRYEETEPGRPDIYYVPANEDKGMYGDYASLENFAKRAGLKRNDHDNGGIPVKYGENFTYYYYLNDLEELVISGRNLYHGKVLS